MCCLQAGTLKVGDVVSAGATHGKVRTLSNAAGAAITSAGPSIAVQLIGLNAVPQAGDEFQVGVALFCFQEWYLELVDFWLIMRSRLISNHSCDSEFAMGLCSTEQACRRSFQRHVCGCSNCHVFPSWHRRRQTVLFVTRRMSCALAV